MASGRTDARRTTAGRTATRLQVILSKDELASYQVLAARHGTTLSGWVRQTLRAARAGQPGGLTADKLGAIRHAAAITAVASEVDEILMVLDG